MDKAEIFWVVFSPPTQAFFLKEVGWEGAQKILKFKLEKRFFHCYNWVGSCEEIEGMNLLIWSISFGSSLGALRLPRPPSKVEVAPRLQEKGTSSHWGLHTAIWLLGSKALTFWEFKATPASNPTLQRPRYSEVRRTDDERNPLAEAGRCKQANMWLCRNVLQCCFLQEHLTDATAGGSCNTAWITFGGHKDEWIEVGVSWICWFVDGCYVDGVQKRLENEKGRRL